jgi:hypothetical protein
MSSLTDQSSASRMDIIVWISRKAWTGRTLGDLPVLISDRCQSLLIEASRAEQIIATAEEPLFLE